MMFIWPRERGLLLYWMGGKPIDCELWYAADKQRVVEQFEYAWMVDKAEAVREALVSSHHCLCCDLVSLEKWSDMFFQPRSSCFVGFKGHRLGIHTFHFQPYEMTAFW